MSTTQPLDIPTERFRATAQRDAAASPPAAARPGTGTAGHRAGAAGALTFADPRLLAWIRRVVIALIVGVIAGLFLSWRIGVSAAAIAALFDTVYNSRTMALIPAAARVTSAQRMSRRRLALARPSGYMAVHARAIPGTESVIDHLLIGPGGVVALDSERWDRRLPVRTVASNSAAGPVLYHGPFSQKDRLAHARWEAAQASRVLSAEVGHEVRVEAAMVIYGPSVPWKVATLRGVAVFAGGALGKYLRGRNRASRGSRLGSDQAAEIFDAAERALPPA